MNVVKIVLANKERMSCRYMASAFYASLMCIVVLVCPTVTLAQNISDLSTDKARNGMCDLVDTPVVDKSVFLHPDRIRYDSRCFQIEGKDEYIFSGTMHYFRVPRPLWRDRLEKMCNAGFNCVETYVPWNLHEREMPLGPDDFSMVDLHELEEFLCLAEELGLYVIVRPGPYICAEWDGGGLPQWLMLKRPEHTLHKVWMQSDDPEFVRWSIHWYKAVCRVVAPHQLTRRPVGGKGVILFQIENEYERVKWFPAASKRRYLEALAASARNEGIEVPLLTCWTRESRNVATGPLAGVLDMVNSYPKWNVARNIGRQVDLQLETQPGRPLISGELQGGWCCELGWKWFSEQEGLIPMQTQNLMLYALQRGFSAVNFYMAVGGTNFDDRAARNQVSSYDYAAAIGEDGSVTERYYRYMGLSKFCLTHGIAIARGRLVTVPYVSSDSLVKLAVRETDSGDRYYFVRTEDHTRRHDGYIVTEGERIDFSLEPFGARVLYKPVGGGKGIWYPEQSPSFIAQSNNDVAIPLDTVAVFSDPQPKDWTELASGTSVDEHGIYGRHYIFYKTRAYEGRRLAVGRPGRGAVNNTGADTILVCVNGELVPACHETKEAAYYDIPGDSLTGRQADVLMLYENRGLHHHVNAAVERYWHTGPQYVRSGGCDIPLSYAYTEKADGERYSSGTISTCDVGGKDGGGKATLLKWHVFRFCITDTARPVWLHLEQRGNGFIYVNGHCIGRCWQQGPQRDYYIPECLLDKDGSNTLVVSLRPCTGEPVINSINLKNKR